MNSFDSEAEAVNVATTVSDADSSYDTVGVGGGVNVGEAVISSLCDAV